MKEAKVIIFNLATLTPRYLPEMGVNSSNLKRRDIPSRLGGDEACFAFRIFARLKTFNALVDNSDRGMKYKSRG